MIGVKVSIVFEARADFASLRAETRALSNSRGRADPVSSHRQPPDHDLRAAMMASAPRCPGGQTLDADRAMNRIRRTIGRLALAAIASLAVLPSCSLITGVDEDGYLIRVDSIVAPPSVRPADTLHVVLHGVVGNDGCYRLHRIESRRNANDVELVVRGIHRSGRGVGCTLAVVMLRESFSVPPPLPDPFTIVVRQPGGGTLEKPIVID